MNKMTFDINDDKIKFCMPINKVNKQNRTVEGFATLDNVDTDDDIIPAEASLDAFASWRGNIREMHKPIAVGKMLSFSEAPYFDPKSDKFYKGIWVKAYISKGAQDTWEKILDGTLTGFSIGGGILDAESNYNHELGKTVRIVKKYRMKELSLVDNPGNQLANILSISKSAGGDEEFSGLLTETKLENVLWCKGDNFAITSESEDVRCGECGDKLVNIGWIESADDEKLEKVAQMVKTERQNLLNKTISVKNIQEGTITVHKEEELTKGGANMTEEVTEVKETEKPAGVTEVEEVNIEKIINDVAEKFSELVKSSQGEAEQTLGEVKETLDALSKSVDEKLSALDTKFSGLEKRVSEVDGKVETVEKRVHSVENDTAVKKSGEVEEKMEKRKTSFWGNSIFPQVDTLLED